MSDPRVSVIIPAHDSAATLDRTLDALRRQILGDEFEVIVVDDGSSDETPEIVLRHEPFARLVRLEHNSGAGSARNHGVSVARAPVLAFTDADCFPTEDWLARGLDALADAELVQGRVIPDPAVGRTPFDRSLSVERDHAFYQTANLIVSREIFDLVGGFSDWARDDGYSRIGRSRRPGRPVGEDTLFGWNALRCGAKSTFAREALVYHVVTPGSVREAMADRWHWTTKMPGLVRLVPELRRTRLYRRWFFDYWTAYFDLAILGLCAAALRRRKLYAAAAIPYARRLRQDAGGYDFGAGARGARLRRVLTYVLGTSAVDGVTVAGLIFGSIARRCLVL